MKLRILDLAEADLLSGFRFYERRSREVGWYFLDSHSATLSPYTSTPAYTGNIWAFFGCCLVVFPMPFITESRAMRSRCGAFWIAGAIHDGFRNNSGTPKTKPDAANRRYAGKDAFHSVPDLSLSRFRNWDAVESVLTAAVADRLP